ncbi:MAG: chromosome segregation protein SMC, partial [Nitrosospira sp.]|nr:chromosome segregation protein SMC [Nitrosospira sp.]
VEQDALLPPDMENLSRLHRETEGAAADLIQKQEVLAQTENLLLNAEEVKCEFAHKARALEQRIIQAEARLNALQRLQHRLEDNEGLSTWLVNHQLDTLPRLWQSIQIEKGWEDALEAVLRERLNSAQLEQLEAAYDWAEDPPPGKWALFESAKPSAQSEPARNPPRSEDIWTPLYEYLTCNDAGIKWVLDEWLSEVFVVDSVRDGLSQRTKLSSGQMLVTREGHVFTRHSLTYYAPDSQLHGVLARQREMARIKIEVDALSNGLSVEKSALDTAEKTCSELESSVSRLRDDTGQLRQQYHDAQIEALKLTQLAERANQRRSQIDSELTEIAQHAVGETTRERDAETKLAEYQLKIGTLREQVQNERLASAEAEQFLQAQRHSVQNAAREMQEAAFSEKTCQNKIAELENSVHIIDENVVELKTNLEKLQVEQGGFDEAPLNSLLQEWLTLREQREQGLAAVRNALEEAAGDLRRIEQERMTCEQKLHPLRESINRARLKEQEARITENQFGAQLKEAGANEEELIQALGKTRSSSLQAEINRLNIEINALGAVNLVALEELQASRTRQTYLDSQSEDVKEAVETLENAIRRIDRETRERLLETVDKVNGHLSEMFPTIFGGGQARLILRGEEILDSGVQIFAQPPGKKNSSIHLLSGGEKALTALALVFSLFQLNPAPFCLLDEVDAPLDDSNTERFCNLVKKLSRDTQFVFISHNKITMEMAQQLIGITMQEQGISRVVAVEIDEAVRLSDAAMVT